MSLTCLLKTHLEQNTAGECKDDITATSSRFAKEANICEKTEDLNVSKSSEISLNLRFSDTEELIGLNSPEFEENTKSRNDLDIKSINKDKFTHSNEREVECTEKSTKNKNETIYFDKSKMQNEKVIDENSCSESVSKFEVGGGVTNSNIVFSVPKITLSEDDNIYTDSDTASGISCDSIGINKNASMETSANNFDSSFTMLKNENNTKLDNFASNLNNQNDAVDNRVTNSTIKDTNFENSSVDLTLNKCENEAMNTNNSQQLYYCHFNDVKNESKSLNSSLKNVDSTNMEVEKIKTNAVIYLNNEKEKTSSKIGALGL